MKLHLLISIFLAILATTSPQQVAYLPGTIEEILFSSKDNGEKKISKNSGNDYRLPNNFEPYHYDIRVRPILEDIPGDDPQYTAPGNVTIYGKCVSPTTNITLHSQVRINEASVKVLNVARSQEVPIVRHSYDTEKTFYILNLGEALEKDMEYLIYIEYVAQVYLENLEGLYRNHYVVPETGEIKYSVTTQLQAFGARKVFPSFDEPAMKATFDITLGRRNNYSSISNSPLISSVPIPGLNGWSWDIFNSTVRMPTYLLAIIISDFAYEEADTKVYRKPVRTYGPRHLIEQGHGIVPSEIAAKVLSFFEEFFDIEYAMHKMDSVGIDDFPAGAMENWGLNIYKGAYLLYSPDQDNEKERRGVALTLNHELAHQWAGNLLTFDWWTMAWLNEGFATYLSYLGMERTNPEYEPRKAIQFDCVQNAFRNDVDNSHPTVLPEKGNPWDTMTYNAHLVYSKGAALLRMMEGFLTLETLQTALQKYMKTYSFQAVNQDHLWEMLDNQAHIDHRLPVNVSMKTIMDTWTLQKGYPLLRVLKISEDRILINQKEYKPDNLTRVYYIPIAVATRSNPNIGNTLPQHWLYQDPVEINIPYNTQEEWILANSGGTGYYRVEYDDELTIRLQKQLDVDHEIISVGSRSQLVDDYLTFFFDGRTKTQNAFGFLNYLDREIDFPVWNAFMYHMNKPRRLMLGRSNAEGFERFIHHKLSGSLTGLRNSGQNLTTGAANLLHSQLIDWAISVRVEEAFSLAHNYYDQWKTNSSANPLPPLLRPRIYCAAVQGPTEENFMFILKAFMNEPASTRSDIIKGLACRNDPVSLYRLLDVLTGTTSEIPKEYSQTVVTAVASVYENFGNVVPFLINNFDGIVGYQGSTRLIANTIGNFASTLSTSEDLSIVQSFIELTRNKFTDTKDLQILENAVTTVTNNLQWMNIFGRPMLSWFEKNY